MSAIGIMDGAFFVGRKDIIDWINTTLDVSINRIEDTASGAIACQLLDIMYPNTLPMHKVNWSANKDFEYIANYKLLQTAFNKNSIDKHIDVDRLISGRYMDNLEFMQWFKRFFEMHVTDKGDYDAITVRSKGKGGSSFFPLKVTAGSKKPTPAVVSKPTTTTTTKSASNTITVPSKPKPTVSTTTTKPSSSGSAKPTTPTKVVKEGSNNSVSETLKSEISSLKSLNNEKDHLINELKQDVENVEKERDFYFEKLREIEILIQDEEDNGRGNELTASILKVLYATADGFEVINNSNVVTNESEETIGASNDEETY